MTAENKISPPEILLALSCLLNSKTLSRSDSICRILKFLVEKSVAGSVDDIKEYTIATGALGRSEDFDPRTDNIVRVQVQRLRQKLEEYYSTEGAADPVRILIPRGHYTPEFHAGPNHNPPVAATEIRPGQPQRQPTTNTNRLLNLGRRWEPAMVLLIVALLVGIRLLQSHRSDAQVPRLSPQLPSPLAPMWKPFLSPAIPLLIVYSNPLFLMDGRGDLYRYSASSDNTFPTGFRMSSQVELGRPNLVPRSAGPLFYCDLYSGTGEVVAAASIAQFLGIEHQHFLIKRSRLVSYADIRNSNVIFIGGSVEDSILKELPVTKDLTFAESSGEAAMGNAQICDRDPPAGKQHTYRLLRDGKTGTLEGEYALISLLPSVVPGRYVMEVGGLTTLGTEAAAEFATSSDEMAMLGKMLPTSHRKSARSNYFQALLRIAIRDGAVAKTECLFVRELHVSAQ